MRLQDQRRSKRGFTLVELMIVVAIIGVLAALAIYGVRKYLANAKTAEARLGLGRLAKDGQLAYEKETVSIGVVKLTQTADIGHRLCSDAAPVPFDLTKIANKKYQSTPGDWASPVAAPLIPGGWNCLRFTISDPQYFQYEYDLVTGDATKAVEPDDQYTVHARGDLDGDGIRSHLSMDGRIQTEAGELILTLAPTITEVSPDE